MCTGYLDTLHDFLFTLLIVVMVVKIILCAMDCITLIRFLTFYSRL